MTTFLCVYSELNFQPPRPLPRRDISVPPPHHPIRRGWLTCSLPALGCASHSLKFWLHLLATLFLYQKSSLNVYNKESHSRWCHIFRWFLFCPLTSHSPASPTGSLHTRLCSCSPSERAQSGPLPDAFMPRKVSVVLSESGCFPCVLTRVLGRPPDPDTPDPCQSPVAPVAEAE